MIGMDAETGKAIGGEDHLRQSIRDILWTPIGTRVARRDYGSLLSELIDQPMNPAGRLRLVAAIALALGRWEPRIRLTRTQLRQSGAGAFELVIEGIRTDVPAPNARTLLTLPLRPTGNFTAYA